MSRGFVSKSAKTKTRSCPFSFRIENNGLFHVAQALILSETWQNHRVCNDSTHRSEKIQRNCKRRSFVLINILIRLADNSNADITNPESISKISA